MRLLTRFTGGMLLKIAAWKGRGKIPVSIELTASLIEVVRKDETVSNKGRRMAKGGVNSEFDRSEMENRLLYAMALTRVVNGLVAPFQQAQRAKSVAMVCQTLGLPPNLVELRHEAAHAEIPSLAALRPVAIACLHWLYERYWLRQQQFFEDTNRLTGELLLKLSKLRKKISSDSFGPQTPHYEAYRKQSKAIVSDLLNMLTYSQVLACLVPKFAALLVPVKIGASQLERKVIELPRRLSLMWMDIITKFVKKWDCFLPALLVALAENLFMVTDLLPRFNPKLPPLNNLVLEKEHKFKISILRCWYERLISEFFEIRVSSEKVDEMSNPSKREGDIGDQMGDMNGTTATSELDAEDNSPSSESTSNKKKASSNDSHQKSSQKKQKGTQNRTLLRNDLLPFKPILHVCLQHLNKHSIKLIKLTVCYMSDGSERDAILPKLSTLFHFRSRALNLSRAEQTLANGGPEERVQELSKRAESSSDSTKPKTELSLADFQTMLRASSSPLSRVFPLASSDAISSVDHAENSTRSPSGSTQDNSSVSSFVAPQFKNQSHSTRNSAWVLIETLPPGICQSPSGSFDYSLPLALDSFRLASFLVPKHFKPVEIFSTPVIKAADVEEGAKMEDESSVDEYSVFGGYQSSDDENEDQEHVERKEKPERTTESDEDAPEAKRRCLEPTAEQLEALAAAEKKKEEEAAKKKVAEKAKVKLMVGIKKTKK